MATFLLPMIPGNRTDEKKTVWPKAINHLTFLRISSISGKYPSAIQNSPAPDGSTNACVVPPMRGPFAKVNVKEGWEA